MGRQKKKPASGPDPSSFRSQKFRTPELALRGPLEGSRGYIRSLSSILSWQAVLSIVVVDPFGPRGYWMRQWSSVLRQPCRIAAVDPLPTPPTLHKVAVVVYGIVGADRLCRRCFLPFAHRKKQNAIRCCSFRQSGARAAVAACPLAERSASISTDHFQICRPMPWTTLNSISRYLMAGPARNEAQPRWPSGETEQYSEAMEAVVLLTTR